MWTTTESVLDGGGHGVAQAIAAVLLSVGALLLLSIFVPIFVLGSLLAAVGIRPSTGPGPASPLSLSPAPVQAGASNSPRLPLADSTAVQVAQRYLGVPYVFGGTNPAVGLDCSGLVQLVFHQLGINLPRTAQQQFNATPRIDRNSLQPGDLVFFARTYDDPHDFVTHVGIYVGDGKQINAPTEGQVVSIQAVFSGFWGAHFIGGGRATRN